MFNELEYENSVIIVFEENNYNYLSCDKLM